MIGVRAGIGPPRVGFLLAMLATAAAADSFDMMGTVTVMVVDTDLELWVPFDNADHEVYVSRMASGVMTIYIMDAFSGTPGGSLRDLRLSLSVTIAGGTVRAGDLIYFAGPDAAVFGAGSGIGTLSFDRVAVEDATLSFEFSAQGHELDPTDFEPAEGGSRITLSGDARVTFQDRLGRDFSRERQACLRPLRSACCRSKLKPNRKIPDHPGPHPGGRSPAPRISRR